MLIHDSCYNLRKVVCSKKMKAKLYYLGRIEYSKALALQNMLVNWIYENRKCMLRPIVLLLEHFPVYTVGLRNDSYSKEDENALVKLGAEFVRTNRGGLITFHGPGQLVVYPIFDARKVKIGPKKYIENLEKTNIEVCQRYKLIAKTSEDTGVWIGQKKICAIGINAQKRIYSHGIALNCNTDLKWFEHIVPCGIENKGVTSLSNELGRNISVHDAMPVFCEIMQNIFEWDFDKIYDLKNADSKQMNDLMQDIIK